MNLKSFYNILIYSLEDLVKNPWLAFFPVVFYIIAFLLSSFSISIQSSFQTSLSATLWLSSFTLIQFLLISSLSLTLTLFSLKIINSKTKIKSLLSSKRIFKFVVLTIFYIIVIMLINLLTYTSAGYLSQSLLLSLNWAMAVFILIYLALILGILIFLTFSSFISIIQDKSILGSIKSSVQLVKSNYLLILFMGLGLYLINMFLSSLIELNSIIIDIITYLILIPYLFLVLTRFVLHDLPTKR